MVATVLIQPFGRELIMFGCSGQSRTVMIRYPLLSRGPNSIRLDLKGRRYKAMFGRALLGPLR